MKCDQVQEQFPDYLSGAFEATAKAEIDGHLAHCQACREELDGLQQVWGSLSRLPEEKPSAASAVRFHAMLDAYSRGAREAAQENGPRPTLAEWLGRLWPRQPAFQFALSVALFAAGLVLGPALAQRLAVSAQGTKANDVSIAQLKDEISNMRQLLTVALLQQPSATERLRGVNWSYQLQQPDHEVLSALLRALDTDPNVNVRLAAVDALRQFGSDATVRKGLMNSLPDQESPIIQIELINVMVELKETESLPVLKRLSQDQDADPSVRARAEWGVNKLG